MDKYFNVNKIKFDISAYFQDMRKNKFVQPCNVIYYKRAYRTLRCIKVSFP